jgi:hypothetical protein
MRLDVTSASVRIGLPSTITVIEGKATPRDGTSKYRNEIKPKEIVAALQVIGWSKQPITPRRQLLLASSTCTPDSTTSETS